LMNAMLAPRTKLQPPVSDAYFVSL
jgi:hypothetical protein